MYRNHPNRLPHKISALLYIIVLVIPLGFYSTYSSFDTIREDSTVLQQSGWMQGLLPFVSQTDTPLSENTLCRIDNILERYKAWIEKNKNSEYYIGTQTLQKDLEDAQNCWRLMKENSSGLTPSCAGQLKSLSVTIQEIVKSKQNKTVNLFYISLSITMLVVLFSIYMLRLYMQHQMKKHAIHDGETALFNKKYFLSVLQNACAESKRYHTPLSALWISVTFESTADKKAKKQFYREFGTIVSGAIRSSDIAARYSDPASAAEKTLFCILLPMTSEAHGEVLASRLQETLGTKLSADASKNTLGFSIDAYDQEENCERFIEEGRSVLE